MQGKKDNETVYDSNDFVELALFTSIGDRQEQQDNFGYMLNQKEALIVVCDGMGGHEKGKQASNNAVRVILDTYADIKKNTDTDPVEMLNELTMSANREVCAINADGISGTTLVLVYINGRELFWNSVGDSRAYILRGSKYSQFTQDQNFKTVLEEKLSRGLISNEEFEQDIVNGESLINYLGMDPLELIDYNVKPLNLESNDRIVLMTDGLYKYLDEDNIFQLLKNFRNINDAVNALENRVKNTSRQLKQSRDNMTVALIKAL